MDDKLDKILSALDELAGVHQTELERINRRNHLTEHDHEMIRRGFAKYDAVKHLSLQERAIVVKREKAEQHEVLGLRVQNDMGGSRPKPLPRKKHTVLPPDNTDALSELHAHLSSLRDRRRNQT